MIAAHFTVSILVALAMARPQLRPGVVWMLIAASLTALVTLVMDASNLRSLDLTHAFSAFEGSAIKSKDFLTGTVEAPGWYWPLVALAYCAGWALLLRWMKAREFHPFLGPLLVSWSGLFAIIGFEMTAAPAGLVTGFASERVLLPAGLAAAVMLPRRCEKLIMVFCWLSVFVSAARVPLVLIGTLATQGRWGNTSLDVHTITVFANPLMQRPVEAAAGSNEQLGWLIWGPEIFVLPALYMLSLSSIAFMATMLLRHPKT